MILAGDIGGTKTHLALIEDVEKRKIIQEKKYISRDYSSLEEIGKQFLSSYTGKIKAACFGIAGPIVNQVCRATNLSWVIDGSKLSQCFQIRDVFLINDVEANAWGISCLYPQELACLHEGVFNPGNQALVSAGTGLGEAGLYWDGKKHHPFACEGGHCSFAPSSEEEVELWRYLKKKYNHVSYERVLSGMAIRDIYQFIIEMKKEKESSETKERIKKEDAGKVIAEGICPASRRTMELFTSVYGAEVGNVALKFFAVGGVFLGGGIAPKILSFLQSDIFMKSYLDKGRFDRLLSTISVRVILNENTALLGAARYGQEKNSL